MSGRAKFIPMVGTFLTLGAVWGFTPGRDDCGECTDLSEWYCENVLEMGPECHAWDSSTGNEPRGEDPHTPKGDYEIGLGTCDEEHSGTCGGETPQCPSEDKEQVKAVY